MQRQLHIPSGIRFLCTGCGHCCHEYPVPLTEADVMRLRAVDPLTTERSISVLTASERGQVGLSAFSYSLDKGEQAERSGNCSFLTEDKRCRVHDLAKPSMCRLFPYTFLHCPDGVRVALSFASTGVLYNSGLPLSEQSELLEHTHDLFLELYPELPVETLAKWSRTQYVAGATIVYDQFLRFEAYYLSRLQALVGNFGGADGELSSFVQEDSAELVLRDMFASLAGSLPVEMLRPLATSFPALDAGKLDQYLLMPFYIAYVAASDQAVRADLITMAVMTYLQNEKRDLYFVLGDEKISFPELCAIEIGPYSPAEADLINRFIYVKLFARLYFGPGFSMLPLLTGIFHLSVLLTLIRLALKLDKVAALRLYANAEAVSGLSLAPSPSAAAAQERLGRVAELLREIDRRLTAVDYAENTAAMLELFALDPNRLERFIALAQ
jgi:Fe-S-cluster containining protein